MEIMEGIKNSRPPFCISCIPGTKVAEEWLTEYF